MTTPYLNCTAKLGITYLVNEQLQLDNQSILATPTIAPVYTLTNGLAASADSIDLHFEDPAVTLAPSASKTYTLSALVDQLPRSINFVDIHTFILQITTRTAGDFLTFGPGAVHGWTALVATGTQKCFGLTVVHLTGTDVLAVATGSNDQLTITNAGSNPITFTLGLAGNSA